jgi:VIT1/CCC1 family predicted Fe2+/Mn2+ transporter
MSDEKSTGKGRPTPKRKEREAEHFKPLVGDKSKEARKAERARLIEERRKARIGMMNGEERFLTIRDRGPQKRMARDLVDSRFTFGELVLPALVVVILISVVDNYYVQLATLLTMWVLFISVGINAWLIGRNVKKRVAEKYGEANLERGLAMYAAMRSIQMRPMRLPKPQVARGAKP